MPAGLKSSVPSLLACRAKSRLLTRRGLGSRIPASRVGSTSLSGMFRPKRAPGLLRLNSELFNGLRVFMLALPIVGFDRSLYCPSSSRSVKNADRNGTVERRPFGSVTAISEVL